MWKQMNEKEEEDDDDDDDESHVQFRLSVTYFKWR